MTEKKIVLYIGQKTISEKSHRAFLRSLAATNSKVRLVDCYVFNSLGSELEEIFKKLNIDRKTLIGLRKRSISEIAVIRWFDTQKHLCRLDITEKPDLDFLKDTLESFRDKGCSLVLKIDNEYLLNLTLKFVEVLNLFAVKNNILVTTECLRSNPFRYRIYLNERLLTERHYPIDLESDRMIAETIYLKDGVSGKITVESDFDLQIKRVEVDDQKQDIYDTVFALPHSDK